MTDETENMNETEEPQADEPTAEAGPEATDELTAEVEAEAEPRRRS